MENAKKIWAMTKLAIYDKKHGEKDRKITLYRKGDYVYRQNLKTRIGVLIACVMLWFYYLAYQAFVLEANIFALVSRESLIGIGIIVLVTLGFYSLVGIIVNGQDYRNAENRLKAYNKMLEKLYANKVGSDN